MIQPVSNETTAPTTADDVSTGDNTHIDSASSTAKVIKKRIVRVGKKPTTTTAKRHAKVATNSANTASTTRVTKRLERFKKSKLIDMLKCAMMRERTSHKIV